MKKFIFSLMAFLLLLFVLDRAFGFGLTYLQNHAKGGDTARNNYICNDTEEDILIFGSSKAIHHYDPRIIEDSLQMTCYNCGNDGNGIVLLYGRYRMIEERYLPKVILYDVTSFFDLEKGDNSRYLDWLRPYYYRSGIDSIFWSVDKSERYKMYSSMYQYNSKILQLISDNIFPQQYDIKGYRPVNKKMQYEPEVTASDEEYEYDSLKLYYLEKLIKDCSGKVKLIFITSPNYKATDDRVYEPLKDLCKEYDIPLLNHYCDSDFVFNKNYFYDSVHLNQDGATAFTNKVIGEVKRLLVSYPK